MIRWNLRPSLCFLSFLALLFPSSGYDVYAFVTSYSYFGAYWPAAPRYVAGLLLPKYMLLEPVFAVSTGFGFLPGLLPPFMFVYISLYFVCIWLAKRDVSRGVLLCVSLVLVFNCLSISATGVSANFLLIYLACRKQNIWSLVLCIFLSPIGFVLGTPIFVLHLVRVQKNRLAWLFVFMILLFSCLQYASYAAFFHPTFDTHPLANIDISSIDLVLRLKATEFVGLSTLVTMFIVLSLIRRIRLPRLKSPIGLNSIYRIIIFLILSCFTLLRMVYTSEALSVRPVDFVIGSLRPETANQVSRRRLHEALFCYAFISPALCDSLWYGGYDLKNERLELLNAF